MTLMLDLFPKASGYILGTYDVDPGFLVEIEKSQDILKLLDQLETCIEKFHPKWNRDEIYWRGVDLADAFDSACSHLDLTRDDVSENEKLDLLHRIKKKTKHHHSLIILTHAIGTKYYESQH